LPKCQSPSPVIILLLPHSVVASSASLQKLRRVSVPFYIGSNCTGLLISFPKWVINSQKLNRYIHLLKNAHIKATIKRGWALLDASKGRRYK
jgi:hypothetical protein